MDAQLIDPPSESSINLAAAAQRVLIEFAEFLGDDKDCILELVFDAERDRYLLVELGWERGYRIYGTLIHLEVLNSKIWVQQDGTEEGIAVDLVNLGVPKHQIVLGFKDPSMRALTEFAVE